MLRKCVNWFFGLCTLVGLIALFGTVGMSDLNLIDFKTILVRCVISLVLILVGYVGLRFNEFMYVD